MASVCCVRCEMDDCCLLVTPYQHQQFLLIPHTPNDHTESVLDNMVQTQITCPALKITIAKSHYNYYVLM